MQLSITEAAISSLEELLIDIPPYSPSEQISADIKKSEMKKASKGKDIPLEGSLWKLLESPSHSSLQKIKRYRVSLREPLLGNG